MAQFHEKSTLILQVSFVVTFLELASDCSLVETLRDDQRSDRVARQLNIEGFYNLRFEVEDFRVHIDRRDRTRSEYDVLIAFKHWLGCDRGIHAVQLEDGVERCLTGETAVLLRVRLKYE